MTIEAEWSPLQWCPTCQTRCVSSVVPFVGLQAFPHWGTGIKVRHCCQLLCIDCRSLLTGSSRNTLLHQTFFLPFNFSDFVLSSVLYCVVFSVYNDRRCREKIHNGSRTKVVLCTQWRNLQRYNEDITFWPHFNRPYICKRVLRISKSNCYFRLSLRLSVLPSAWNNFFPSGRIFMKFDIWVFFENLSRNFKLYWNLTGITGTLHERQYMFLIISRSIILRLRSLSGKSCR